MHQKKIDELIKNTFSKLAENSFKISSQKEMAYARKLEVKKNEASCIIVIYYSPKKGYSFVIEKSASFGGEVVALLGGKASASDNATSKTFLHYTGIDESGKGDYFGPLVVAGFYITPDISDDVKKLGAKDCKKLSDNKVLEIYENLKESFPENIIVKKLMPEVYNKRYAEFLKKGKKLNSLLGSLFAEIIIQSYEKHENLEGIIADKFGDEKYIKEFLSKEDAKNIVCIERAESYLGVAAASVVARAVFILSMEELSASLNDILPFGAGKKVDDVAKNLYKNLKPDEFKTLVKWHFKNTDKITL